MDRNLKVDHKRGIRIQTRFITTILLLLFQIAILFAALYGISESYFWIYGAVQAFGIITVIYIVNSSQNPSYKIAWIVFILLLPLLATPTFLLWGGGRVLPIFRKKMKKCEEHYLPLLPDDGKTQEQLREADFLHARQAAYLTRESGYPIYRDTAVEYLSPGEVFLPKFLAELEKAQQYIYLEFFIIAEGEMWDSVYRILRRKAQEGVEIKVLFDDFGSINRQERGFITRLRRGGIKVAAFNQIGPSLNIFMNNRNHRKIVVIDGKVAVTGGLNLADEYINRFERFGYWMDCAAIFRGRAVSSFLAMFCSMWEFTTGEQIDMTAHLARCEIKSDGFVLPYCDGPLNRRNPAEGLYTQILNTAQKYVYITSPYLIIDSTMISMLQIAARSGIDVRIVTPHIPDKWYVHPVTQYNYYDLLETGVRIYEYTPGFIHSKLFISDDRVATVGTVNMDYRSFILHFECGAWISDSQTVLDIRRDFERILSQSKEVKFSAWKKEPVLRRLKRAILHLFSPFM